MPLSQVLNSNKEPQIGCPKNHPNYCVLLFQKIGSGIIIKTLGSLVFGTIGWVGRQGVLATIVYRTNTYNNITLSCHKWQHLLVPNYSA